MPAPVVSSVLDLIGNTPLVRLNRVVAQNSADVWVKCEHLNPGGSVKDRICLAMIEAAEREGLLTPGMTVVEPTSGNTGIGLAIVCRKKGYKLVLTMPASMSLERRELLKSYGVEIVLTEPERVMDGALEAAQRIAEERGAFMPQQFENGANPATHAATTASEILTAFEGLLSRYREAPHGVHGYTCYSEAFQQELRDSGFLEITDQPGFGLLEAAMLIEAAASCPVSVEAASSMMIGPLVRDGAGPVALGWRTGWQPRWRLRR